MGIKSMWEGYKKDKAYSKAAAREASRRERASYYKARAREAEKYGAERARIEREQRVKSLHASYAKSKGSGFSASGYASNLSSGLNEFFGGSAPAPARAPRTASRTTWKHYKKGGKWHHKKVRSKGYRTSAPRSESNNFGISMPDWGL